MKHVFILILISVFFFACNQSVNTRSEGEKIMQLSRDWSRSAATDSIEKTLSYWDDSATVMSPGQPSIVGKQAIREMILGASQIPGFKISWEPKSVEVSESGDMAYLIEETQITMNDSVGNPVTQRNKAVTIWRKKANGEWKNVVDIWNAN
ncbi:MAG TPA: DUF4440 domain-containing protein [Chitinophagaceae bacterium]